MQPEGASFKLALRPLEAAEALGISERTLWAWTQAGIVPSVRAGTGKRNTVRYPVAELEAWLTRTAAATKGGEQ
jgi:excisionase family DNA binding protein